jgi:hypothetical protein
MTIARINERPLRERITPTWRTCGCQNALKAIAGLSIRDLTAFIWQGMRPGREGIRLIKEQFPAAVYI